MLRILTLMIGAMLASGCADLGLFVANRAAYVDGQKRTADIAYGKEARQLLDVYQPKEPGVKRPVIVFFHGGSWQMGNKNDYPFVADAFTSKGYVVVIPAYGLYPEFRYPVFAEDAARAVAWVEKHIAEYGGDSETIFISGHSAGAHIGALISTDPRYLKRAGASRKNIRAFAGLAGPYDFVPEDPNIVQIFKPAGNAKRAMPATFIDGKQPPMLLLWGDADELVGLSNIESMQRNIKKRGGDLEVKIYPGIGHIGIVGALSRPLRGRAPVVEDMTDFFGRHTGKAVRNNPDAL